MGRFDWGEIEADAGEQLAGLDLKIDRALVERFSAEIAAGRLDAESNRLREDPEPPDPSEIEDLDALAAPQRERLERLGREAFAAGRVAIAVLNGGMATRFGGGVKGIVEAFEGRSFLELKIRQARARGPLPFAVMNSFATHAPTVRFLEEQGLEEGVHPFLQSVSMRLTPQGEPFRDRAGRVSLYAPGHGDFGAAIRRSGVLAALERSGVHAIMLSNVDNLGADPDPLLVGFHLDRGRALTVETARTVPGDVGGAPARVRGRLQVVEGFRFPRGFEFDRLPYVNTNSFVVSTAALGRDWPLTWFYVEKRVDGRAAVQMERLVGELSAFVETAWAGVLRAGTASRYFPVKTREDLEALRADPALVERFTAALRA